MAVSVRKESFLLSIIFVRADSCVHLIRHISKLQNVMPNGKDDSRIIYLWHFNNGQQCKQLTADRKTGDTQADPRKI
ncbi:MAG: hypothetical protein HY841_11995 [Bacteroidetes bacterium]|nr:hypothetical protein [Bacteroidota bacterium]